MKKSPTPHLDWNFLVQTVATVQNNQSRLSFAISKAGESNWQVIAFEMGLTIQDLQSAFEAHTHKIIGTYDTHPKAIEASEAFAQAWLKGYKATQSKACGCKEMVEP